LANGRRTWPGWDGWTLIVLGALIVLAYLARGGISGGWQLGLIVSLDLLYMYLGYVHPEMEPTHPHD
jgi:hypothetical protein